MKKFLLCAALLSLSIWTVSPQTKPSLPSLLDEADRALRAENYQNALKLYEQARKLYPDAVEPASALGDLYTDKKLFRLAAEQYQDVVKKSPGDPYAWLNLAQTYSYLDENKQASQILHDALQRFPTDVSIGQSSAWIDFKNENFQSGIQTLRQIILDRGTNPNIEMTLGTLYSSLLDYKQSREHYIQSISLTKGDSDSERNFRSIAWYNLAILEGQFYQYALSQKAIENSLKNLERPYSLLMQGELHQSRLDFSAAQRAFERATKGDESPNSLLDLAKLYQEFGFLDESLAAIKSVEDHRDDSWMSFLGITRQKFKANIEEIAAKTWKGKLAQLDFEPRQNPWDWVVWIGKKIGTYFQYWYHDQTYRALLIEIAQSSEKVENYSDAWVNYAMAQKPYPDIALKYIRLLRQKTLPQNPLAEASYLAEEGEILNSAEVLERAVSLFQPTWQNEEKMEALQSLVSVYARQGDEKRRLKTLYELYQLNPGALLQKSFALPVELRVYGQQGVDVPEAREHFKRIADSMSWNVVEASTAGIDYTLNIQLSSDASARWSLRDVDGKVLKQGNGKAIPELRTSFLQNVFYQIHRPEK